MPVETLGRTQDYVITPTENEGAESGRSSEPRRALILDHIGALTPIIRNNDNIVLTAGTGAGKSTFFIHSLWKDILGQDSRIAITQPRRENVRGNHKFEVELVGDASKVGFRFKGANHNPDANIIYYVEGSFLNKIKDDPTMLEFDAIVPDEIHEQGDTTAIVLAEAKKSQKTRKEQNLKPLKIIPTSATMDAEKVKNYLGEGAVWYDVPGEKLRFERTQLYEPEGTSISIKDMPAACARKIIEIIESGDTSAILNFLPGKAQIREVNKILRESGYGDRLEIIEVHSRMTDLEKEKLADKKKRDANKIFVAISTTYAETGITIDGLGHVVDSGLINQKELDDATGIEYLKQVEHSKSGIMQREGRVGRVGPGTIHHMYSKSNYENRPKYQVAGLKRSDLLSFVLNLKNLGYHKYDDFDFLDAPNRRQWDRAENNLKALGALDSSGNVTTKGETMFNMPVDDLNIAGMLYEASANGSLNEAITLAAFMTNESKMPFVRNEQKKVVIPQEYIYDTSDYVTFLRAFKDYKQGVRREEVDQNIMKRVDDMRTQIAKDLKYKEPFNDQIDEENIQKAIALGFIDKLMQSGRENTYKIRSGYVGLDRASVLSNKDHSLVVGSSFNFSTRDNKIYAQLGQEVKREWIDDETLQLLKDVFEEQKKEVKPTPQQNFTHIETEKPHEEVTTHSAHDETHESNETPHTLKQRIRTIFEKIKNGFKKLFRSK